MGLPSHTPVHGDATVPLHGAPPTATAQIGHGCVGLPVSTVAELSWNVHVAAPVEVFSVPVGPAHVPVPAPLQHANGLPAPRHPAFEKNVFVTQTESPAFAIGSGVPNLQPGAVQSTPGGVDPAPVTPRVQFGPAHERLKRLIAPGGVALSGTAEMPPPSDRLPQRRFFNGIVPATSRNVVPQKPTPAVDVKSKPDGAPPIVVEVLDDDVLVLVLDVVGAAVDDELLVDVLVEVVLVVDWSVVGIGADVDEDVDDDEVVLVVVDEEDEDDPVVDVVASVVGGAEVVVTCTSVVLVVDGHWQATHSCGRHKPPSAEPSHCSPGSITPLPHWNVVEVVLVLVLELVVVSSSEVEVVVGSGNVVDDVDVVVGH